MSARFGVSRRMSIGDIDGAWLVVVIRPFAEPCPDPVARHIDTYKMPGHLLPEDPALVGKIAQDLRDLADELDRRGWHDAFRRES